MEVYLRLSRVIRPIICVVFIYTGNSNMIQSYNGNLRHVELHTKLYGENVAETQEWIDSHASILSA